MSMRRKSFRRESGFSLIEVLVAVVILATGLLALTALQGRLAQTSAEAKVRSRVASLLTSRLDELRAVQYVSIPPVMPPPPTPGQATATTSATCVGGAAWVCTAQNESGVGGLTVGHAYERFMDNLGTFQSSGAQPLNLSTAEFKRITLTATWTDATGVPRSLAVSTDVSPLSLTATPIPNAPGGAGAGGKAIVRQDNPAGPGVIPIAIGGGDATAASNPRPEIIHKNQNQSAVGTRFDVLTYQGMSGASVIQRRVETAVVACKCEYGAGGTNLGEIYRTAQWPAEWTGEKYEVIAPTGAPQAPGDALASKSGPAANATQSPLCTECCRDHHDDAANTLKFDPERMGSYARYNGTSTAVNVANGAQYINACRLVRVDGFWRTATDMYAKHFGLINTAAVAGVAAKSGAPDATAVTTYQAYVKSYLGAGYTGAASIVKADDGGQVSGAINITAPPPADERYLHARGLYVDYLNTDALTRINKARTNCPGGDLTECMLPYLPFTTINATELAFWEPRVSGTLNTNTITVASGSSLVYDPLQPTRGRTNARSTAANGATADAAALITRSNAGVAIASPVDPGDAAAQGVDQQAFRVTASGTPITGQSFSVRLVGLPQTADTSTTNDPAITWMNVTGTGNCNGSISGNDPNPNDYGCDTFGPLGIATTLTVQNYFQVIENQSRSQTCVDGSKTVTEDFVTPKLTNYRVSTATVNGTAAATNVPSNDNTDSESTAIGFANVPNAALVELTFVDEGNGAWATIKTCKVAGSKIQSITWNEPWAHR